MREYKYNHAKDKFLKNGHTMFAQDVLTDLERLAYLEDQISQGQLAIDNVSDCKHKYKTTEYVDGLKHVTCSECREYL